ncbi:MAG: helix-turn-helix domain-containing protein [Devosia sp.]
MYEMMGSAGGARIASGSSRRRDERDAQCDTVIALIAQEKNVPVRLLVHRSRCRNGTARARQLAMYLCHVAVGRSLQAVGEVFGRDRTTVSYACALIEDMRDDTAFDAAVAALERRIEAALGGDGHAAR